MTTAIYLLAALVLFMLAGVLPARGGTQAVVFCTPVFVVLLGALSVSLLVCAWRRRLSWRQVGFQLTHLAIVLVLVGAFIGFAFGKQAQFVCPVAADYESRELPLPDGTFLTLPFALSVTDFGVSYYDPDYMLYRPSPAAGEAAQGGGYEFVKKIRIPPGGTLDLGEAGSLDAAKLRDESGNWVPELALDSGWLLRKAPPVARHYCATLRMRGEDGAVRREDVTVNHPASHHGWRFYLMSYGEEAGRYVVLSARRDPGRRVVLIGIWALMAGVSIMCFRRQGGQRATA